MKRIIIEYLVDDPEMTDKEYSDQEEGSVYLTEQDLINILNERVFISKESSFDIQSYYIEN